MARRACLTVQDNRGRTAKKCTRSRHIADKIAYYNQQLLGPFPRVSRRGRHEIRKALTNRVALRSIRQQPRRTYSDVRIHYRRTRIEILRLSGPAYRYRLGQSLGNKTVGFVAWPAGSKPITLAVSGWQGDTSTPGVLDNEDYSARVKKLAGDLNFPLRSGWRDNGGMKALDEHRGRETASHVEKQLGLFIVEQALKELCGEGDLTNLGMLRRVRKPETIRNIVICESFLLVFRLLAPAWYRLIGFLIS